MLVYLNGNLMKAQDARISPFDRGFLFADGVYEVARSMPTPGSPDGRFVSINRHVRRLERSLREMGIAWDASQLALIARTMQAQAGLADALLYLQVTRGTPDLAVQPARSHIPPAGLTPTVFAFLRPLPPLNLADPAITTKRCLTTEDLRWQRCDIKSIALLGNVMASNAAASEGCEEAILLRRHARGGAIVSEGALTNVAIVTRKGEIATPSLDSASILPGITRELLLELEPSIVQRVVNAEELRDAAEVLLLGTTASVTSVTHINGSSVGTGTVGPQAKRLNKLLCDAILSGRDDI